MDVLSTDGCGAAGVLAELFERDRELVVGLNAAQRRLLDANERLTVTMPVGAVVNALMGPADAHLCATGRPAVLDGACPVRPLQEVAEAIRMAMIDYQSVAEQRRRLAADIGEATARLVDELSGAGFSEAQARGADVWALRDGIYREA